MLMCGRCPNKAEGGVLLTMVGEPTGHNQERTLLCPSCYRDVRYLLAHGPDSVPPAAKVIDKQQVADRFLRKGVAQ